MSLTKIGSIGINTGIQFAGITTVSTLKVGTGVTLSSDGDIFATGVTTATSFVGDGSQLTGVASTENIRTNTNATFLQNVNVSGTTTAAGNINVLGANITLQDSTGSTDDQLQFGAGSDFRIFHNGTNNYIDVAGDGYLYVRPKTNYYLQNYTSGEVYISGIADGAVNIYYNGSKKLETTNTGVTITGQIISDGLQMGDNEYLKFGSHDDIQIYHDGTNNIFDHVTGSSTRFMHGSEKMLVMTPDSHVELYHDNSKKFETASYGVLSAGQVRVSSSNASTVAFSAGDAGTGFYNAGSNAIGYSANGTQKWNINSAGSLRLVDNVRATFGTDDDLQLYHDNSSNCYLEIHNDKQFHINASTGGSIENMAKFLPNSGVELFNDSVKKFATGSSGVYLDHTGTLGQHNIHFERGQGGGYSNIVGSTNYPDNSSYTADTANYWTFTSAKGGHVAVINSDGSYNSSRNDYDHFSIYQRANTENSNEGRRLFSVDNTGGVQFGLAGVRMDRGWGDQPSITMQRDCNDGTDNTDGSAYFRFHGSNLTHKGWTGASGGNTGADFSCNILIDGSSYDTSDRRAKTDIVDCPYGLDIVNKLQPRKYQLINSALEPQGDDNINLGFIAQEIMEHIPECVNYLGDEANIPNEKGYAKAYVFDSSEVVPVLTKAIQELSAKNDALEARIKTLEG